MFILRGETMKIKLCEKHMKTYELACLNGTAVLSNKDECCVCFIKR